MVLVSVMYPEHPDSKFDCDYFVQKHIPLLKARLQPLGLEDVRVYRGIASGADGPATYKVLSLLTFGSLQDFKKGIAAHGKEIFSDRPNFTSIQPIFQISEPMG